MSLILATPPLTNFYQPVALFSATFNAVTPGFYDFNSPANQAVPIQATKGQKLYLIERYSASASIPEGAYLEACAGGAIPALAVRLPNQTNRMIYPNPIPLINYIDGLETVIYAYGSQDDELTGALTGQLTQPASLVGVLDVTIQVQFNIYEISNKRWIDNFLSMTTDGQAPNLSFPGTPGRLIRKAKGR